MKKFELTSEFICFSGRKLFRIKALINFSNIKAGDLGGYVEKEENLEHDGNAWVYGNAKVCGDAWVFEDAKVCGNACVCGNAHYTTVKGFGSIFRTTTFFRLKNGEIGVKCGCFFGTLSDFRKKVKSTHKESTIAKEYLMLADLMEYHFKERKNNE